MTTTTKQLNQIINNIHESIENQEDQETIAYEKILLNVVGIIKRLEYTRQFMENKRLPQVEDATKYKNINNLNLFLDLIDQELNFMCQDIQEAQDNIEKIKYLNLE